MPVEVADEVEPPDPLIGQTLASRYQIEAKLGEGAMGAVYRAKHVKVGRPFAVKVLHARLLEDPKVVQRFEREAELAGRLRHPNVIGVVDVGEMPDGMRYMVMDFAAGPDLATLLSEAPMPPQRIIHLTRQMLEGLYHAHEHGLIHRDFKPENVIVEHDTHGAEVPRIVDFGIAILREGGATPDGPGRLTTNGLVLGTPHYMAPEQAVADPIDHRIDLFALGIMVYEMLSGKLPFDGNGAEVARANLMLDPPPISKRVPFLEADPLLEAFARRMMMKKRDQRPATAKAARELLDLIERDRMAAAKALGVSPDDVRGPRVTTPTEPPANAGATPRETAPQPPAGPLVASGRQADITTEPTRAGADKSRKTLIIGGAAGVALLGLAAAFALRGGGDKAKDVAPQVPSPPPTMVATNPPPANVDTPAHVDTAHVETPVPVETTKAVDIKHPVHTDKTHGKKTTTTTDKVETTKPVEITKVTPPLPVETQAEPAYTKKNINVLYGQVRRQVDTFMKANGPDAVADLDNKLRSMRLNEVMASQASVDAAVKTLHYIQGELAKRK
jgi:hypothetical protein